MVTRTLLGTLAFLQNGCKTGVCVCVGGEGVSCIRRKG